VPLRAAHSSGPVFVAAQLHPAKSVVVREGGGAVRVADQLGLDEPAQLRGNLIVVAHDADVDVGGGALDV